MSIESEHDLIALQKIGRIVAMAREEMLSSVQAGITTAELDRIGKRLLDEHGAVSRLYYLWFSGNNLYLCK